VRILGKVWDKTGRSHDKNKKEDAYALSGGLQVIKGSGSKLHGIAIRTKKKTKGETGGSEMTATRNRKGGIRGGKRITKSMAEGGEEGAEALSHRVRKVF